MRAHSRNTDPMSSHEGADAAPVTELESKVLNALKGFKTGATSQQIARFLGRQWVSVSPRFRPLANRRLIKDSGIRRKSESGVSHIVWMHT
jgi:hypothetical protein